MSHSVLKRTLLLALSAVYYVLMTIVGWLFPRWSTAGNVILYYHGVADRQREAFRRQVQWLCRRRKIVALSEITDGDRGARCAITFDDAISNILVNALPVLEALQLPATVFAVSGNLGHKPKWQMQEDDPDADVRLMTAEELAYLPRQGIDVGSHTETHRTLSDLSQQEARRELLESRRQLEEIMERSVRLLSIPYGAVRPDLASLAANTGYDMVLTSAPQLVTRGSSSLALGRFGVSPDDWTLEFRLKALGAYAWRRFLPRHRRRACGVAGPNTQSQHAPSLVMRAESVQRGY